ncbi:MAG: TonB-dependent receptor [Bacteroidetes bacterium]|nr:TonB-dependent receptor [bacterium]NBP63449.1 TonB-dependent receptor [Bacteroidota bacterium]
MLLFLLLFPIHQLFAVGSSIDSTKTVKTPSITVSSTTADEQSSVTFSNLYQQDIKNTHTAQDISQTLSLLPSIYTVSQNGNNIGYTAISLRGFDQRRIAVMINGVPQNDPEDHNVYWINMPDLLSGTQQLQVQRGAGLMNYGAAAMAGSVSILTSSGANHPGITYSQFLGFQEYADYKTGTSRIAPMIAKSSLEIQSGLIEGNYAISARLSSIQSDGYRLHSWANLQSYALSATRFDEFLTTQINVYGGPINDALAYTGLPKSWIQDPILRRTNFNGWGFDSTGHSIAWSVNRRRSEVEEFSQPHYELLNEWTIAPNISLKSTLFYYTGEGYFDYDASWADAGTLRLTPEFGAPDNVKISNALVRGFVGNRQGGWIPRLVWNHERGRLTSGIEIRSHRSIHWGSIRYAEGLPAGFDPDFTIYEYNGMRTILSAFTREEYQVNDKFMIQGEVQLVHHDYGIEHEKAGNRFTKYVKSDGSSIENGEQVFAIRYLFANPRMGFRYTLTENDHVIGSLAYTSREPRMNNLYAASDSYFGAKPLFEQIAINDTLLGYDFTKPLVKPESMLNLELGWRHASEQHQFGITLYAMEFFNELVKSGRLDIFGAPIDGNAPRTRHIGIELEGMECITVWGQHCIELSGNMTIGYNRIIDMNYFTNDGVSISLNGNRIAGFPDFMSMIRLGYRTNSSGLSCTMRHVGSFRSDNFDDELHSNTKLIDDLRNSFNGYYADNIVDAYTVFGLDADHTIKGIGGPFQSLRLRLQVINVLDSLYASGAEGKEFFPGQRRMFMIGCELGI